MYYYRIISIILFAVGITFSLTPSVYAEEPISISTSQSLYNEGDTVVVFGTIAKTFQGLPITLQIYHEDNLITVAQVEVALDGSFAKDFSASGPFWTSDGIYIVRGFYTSDKIVETTFEFYKQASIVGSTSFPVDIPNSGTFDMGYTIRGGEIKDVTINKDHNSLLLELAAESSGELVVKLPRSSFDAIKGDGGDVGVTGPAGGATVSFTDKYRTVTSIVASIYPLLARDSILAVFCILFPPSP